jgi:hypothetical protein
MATAIASSWPRTGAHWSWRKRTTMATMTTMARGLTVLSAPCGTVRYRRFVSEAKPLRMRRVTHYCILPSRWTKRRTKTTKSWTTKYALVPVWTWRFVCVLEPQSHKARQVDNIFFLVDEATQMTIPSRPTRRRSARKRKISQSSRMRSRGRGSRGRGSRGRGSRGRGSRGRGSRGRGSRGRGSGGGTRSDLYRGPWGKDRCAVEIVENFIQDRNFKSALENVKSRWGECSWLQKKSRHIAPSHGDRDVVAPKLLSECLQHVKPEPFDFKIKALYYSKEPIDGAVKSRSERDYYKIAQNVVITVIDGKYNMKTTAGNAFDIKIGPEENGVSVLFSYNMDKPLHTDGVFAT